MKSNLLNRLRAIGVAAVLLFSAPLLAGDRPKISSIDASQTDQIVDPAGGEQQAKKCHWWQFSLCKEASGTELELPPEAPRTGPVITVDTSTNTIYLFKDGRLVARGPVATGTEKTLTKGSQIWMFHTPRGRMKVLHKIDDPVWRKPDWAYVEAGQRVPPPDSPKRMVKGHLGKYALDLGDGIMIHGTDETHSLGRKASHGCVRVGNELLHRIYESASIGTDVFIY